MPYLYILVRILYSNSASHCQRRSKLMTSHAKFGDKTEGSEVFSAINSSKIMLLHSGGISASCAKINSTHYWGCPKWILCTPWHKHWLLKGQTFSTSLDDLRIKSRLSQSLSENHIRMCKSRFSSFIGIIRLCLFCCCRG